MGMVRKLRQPLLLLLALGIISISCGPSNVYPAPSFSLEALDGGKVVTRDDLKGKVVLIDFWQTWCAPCRQLMPEVQKLHDKYKDKGVLVIGVTPEDRALVQTFEKDRNYTYPIYLDQDSNTNHAFNVDAIPRTIIIGRSGQVVFDAVAPYPVDLEEALSKAL